MDEAKKDKNKFKIITVTADIHPDGDIYVKGKDGKFHYIGGIEDNEYGEVPNKHYEQIKKII